MFLTLPMITLATSAGGNTSDPQALKAHGIEVVNEIRQEATQISTIKAEVNKALSEAEQGYTSGDSSRAQKYKKAIDYGTQLHEDADYLSQRVTVLVNQYNISDTSNVSELQNAVEDLNTILNKLVTRLDEMNAKIDKLNNYLDQLIEQTDDDDDDDSPDTIIDQRYPNKIVYKMNVAVSTARNDCQRRGGSFNTCGNGCAPNAEACTTLCRMTCTGFEDGDDDDDNQDLVDQAKQKVGDFRTKISSIPPVIAQVKAAVAEAEDALDNSNISREKLERAIAYGNALVDDMEALKAKAESIAGRYDTLIEQNKGNRAQLQKIISDITRTNSVLDSRIAELVAKLRKLEAYLDRILLQYDEDSQQYNDLIDQAKAKHGELWREIEALQFKSGDIESAISLAYGYRDQYGNAYGDKFDRAIRYGEKLREERDYLERRAAELTAARDVTKRSDLDIRELTAIVGELNSLLTKLDGRLGTLDQKIDKLNNYLDKVVNASPSPTPKKTPTPQPSPKRSPSPIPSL